MSAMESGSAERTRAVEEQLNEIYGKSRTAGMTNLPTVSKSFAVDEVLGKLSAESLHLIHEKFKAQRELSDNVSAALAFVAALARFDTHN